MKTLTVAEAARSLDSRLEEVHHQHASYELLKDGIPCARLVPIIPQGCSTRDLAQDLAAAKLGRHDRREMAAAVSKGRKHLRFLKNPWS